MNKPILVQGGDGTAIPEGMVGTVLENSYSSALLSANFAAANVITLALTPGIWRITANGTILNSSAYVATGIYGVGITPNSAKSPVPSAMNPSSTETCSSVGPFASNNNCQVVLHAVLDDIRVTANTNYYITLVATGYTSGQYVVGAFAKAVRTA